MKRYFYFLTILLISYKANAQVAINNNAAAPNPSAMLDVSSGNKGILLPRVHLISLVDNSTVPSPATSLVVYNTNPGLSHGVGFYYNSGTSIAPNWQAFMDIKLPFSKSGSANSSVFNIENYSQQSASIGIRAFSQGGTALLGESVNGFALQTKGRINIAGAGQIPAVGKVLTSDANGNATWEGAIAFSASGIQPGGAAEIYSPKKVAYINEDYDLGNNFNPSTISPHSTFTAPVRGIYHFDAATAWEYAEEGFRSTIWLVASKNGVVRVLADQEVIKQSGNTGNNISRDCLLEAGEQVWIELQKSGTGAYSLITSGSQNYFNGRLVIKL